jgi:hypothetical protein
MATDHRRWGEGDGEMFMKHQFVAASAGARRLHGAQRCRGSFFNCRLPCRQDSR